MFLKQKNVGELHVSVKRLSGNSKYEIEQIDISICHNYGTSKQDRLELFYLNEHGNRIDDWTHTIPSAKHIIQYVC